MANAPSLQLFSRASLDQAIETPDEIISVYVIEQHIWAEGGSDRARAERRAEEKTVNEFLIDPVRSFLNDILRQMAAPYTPERKDNPIGQGYWIQAEFGSGKSHLLSFVGALALGNPQTWQIVRQREQEAGLGRRESLYNFYENGLQQKSSQGRGILVAVKTLVGEGGGAIGMGDVTRNLSEYILDAVADQFYRETGRSLPLYPTQMLAERFLQSEEINRYHRDLSRYLQDPAYFDEEERQPIEEFLDALQNNPNPDIQRDCGQRLWDFYTDYLKIQPRIPMEAEAVLEHMVQRLLQEGYTGLLLILDEVSLFMKGRNDAQRVEDEKALVVLSNRLAKVKNLPVWTICAAQQAIETKMVGVKNIIARERLDLVPLLNNPRAYYDIALSRVRRIARPEAIDQYYADYKRSFSWPQAIGQDEFARFFPFYPPSIDIVRTISYNLTSVRSALYFMLQTLKSQRKRQSRELVTLWALFEDVVSYEEDPSGTTKAIASIKTKWPEAWQAYTAAIQQLDSQIKGPLKIYRSRAEKIIKTLFLYHVADRAPNGLSSDELMNSVMEWKDHDRGQGADLQDNLDHYEILADAISLELAQVQKVAANFRFNPTGDMTPPTVHFQKARAEVEQDEIARRQAWHALLALDGWEISTSLMTLDLGQRTRSLFRAIAPANQNDITLHWHNREITGRVYMRDLLDIAARGQMLPSINSADTGLDFAVFVSATHASASLDQLIEAKQDPRVLFWSPDRLTPGEQALLIDFAAYRKLVTDFSGRETQEARIVLEWVQNRLRDQMGSIYRLVPDSYSRGRMAALDHSQMEFQASGELAALLTPVVSQLLDGVYLSKELEFSAPAPFNDTNAVNVINGIVKVGEIPRGARPNREISAAQNYGFDLQILRRGNDRSLDISGCRYTQEMGDWLDDKLSGGNRTLPASTLYKNFMGIGGPEGRHYGLSKRMVQLYLLCLARTGKIRISLSGRSLAVESIDYSNIADIEFRAALLDAMDQIQLLQAPQGWPLLAPYAAILLDDPELAQTSADAAIQQGIQRLLEYRRSRLPEIQKLVEGMSALLGEMQVDAPPLLNPLDAWQRFLGEPIPSGDPLPYLRSALDKAFGYRSYADDRVEQSELDDLRRRCQEVEAIRRLYERRDALRAAARYATAPLPPLTELNPIRQQLERIARALKRLPDLTGDEIRLAAELLEPAAEAIDSYRVRYLQIFDQVTARSEETRQKLEQLPDSPDYRALVWLARIGSLGGDGRQSVDAFVAEIRAQPDRLSPTALSRAEVEQRLREWPQPPGSALTFDNAAAWLKRIDEIAAQAEGRLAEALQEKAALLRSDALRARMEEQGQDPFIARLLAASDDPALAAELRRALGETDDDEQARRAVESLERALRRVRVQRLRLADFQPSRRTLEAEDVERIVGEFRDFLRRALPDDDDAFPMIELE